MPLQITTERHRTFPTPYPTPLNIADALHTPPYHAYALRSQTAQHPTRLIYAGTSLGGAMPLLCFPLRNQCRANQCDTMTTQGITLRDFTVAIPDLPLLLRFITLLCLCRATPRFAFAVLTSPHHAKTKLNYALPKLCVSKPTKHSDTITAQARPRIA